MVSKYRRAEASDIGADSELVISQCCGCVAM